MIQGYSKGLDLSPEGLRFYERKGIVQPKRDDKTGYRYYRFQDTVAITNCRKLRCWGYTLDEAADTLKTKNFNEQVESLEEHKILLKQEIERQKLMLERMEEAEAVIAESLKYLEKPLKTELPDLSFLPTRIKQETIRNKDLLKQINSWNKTQPFPDIVLLHNGTETMTGLVMNQKYRQFLHLPWQEEFQSAKGISLSLILSEDELEKGMYIQKAEKILHQNLDEKPMMAVLLSAALHEKDMNILCRLLIPE